MADKTFLIIDDNSIDQMIGKSMLKKCLSGAEVFTTSSAEEGLEWLKSKKEALTSSLTILLDMYMPDTDGFGFLDAYSKLDEALRSNTKIIMLSSTQDTERTRTAKDHPLVDNIIDKPLTIEVIEEIA